METHIMFDLETLSTKANAVVMSIGACQFFPSMEGEDCLGDSIHIVLDAQQQIEAGLDVDAETVMWWMNQGDSARHAISKAVRKDTQQGLFQFVRWCADRGCDNMWSHTSFDQPILHTVLETFGVEKSWSFRATRDIRTLQMLAPCVPWVRTGTHHNAMADAVSQARWVSRALEVVGGGKWEK